jgi:hypothetical protein
MRYGIDKQSLQEILEPVVQVILVVEQVLPELLRKPDTEVRAEYAGIRDDGGVWVKSISGETVVEGCWIVADGAVLIVFGLRIQRFIELVNTYAYTGVGVTVVSGQLYGKDERVDNRVVAEVDRRAAEGQLGENAGVAFAEHRIKYMAEDVGGSVGGVDGVLQDRICLQGNGVREYGVLEISENIFTYVCVLILAGAEHDARQEH